MRNTFAAIAFAAIFLTNSYTQAQDGNLSEPINLDEVNIDSHKNSIKNSTQTSLTVNNIQKDFLTKNFTGDISKTISNIPGVQSIDIASSFAKPMIRGMAFNRLAVIADGIKQEGQQWGSDHGLEIDAFNVDAVVIQKGPTSLLYGSDAIGGVIEILKPVAPIDNQTNLVIDLLGTSVNEGLSGSIMLAVKKDASYSKFRYTEKSFGDYKVLTDSIIYLTQMMPIYNQRLKNTAGLERNFNFYTEYKIGKYSFNYSISNVYQKAGFFPGAHGLPNSYLVQDDGSSRNIELPYSRVNHLKLTSEQKYVTGSLIATLDIGYQNNHREENSKFHTHYAAQKPPEENPNQELVFNLDTYSSSLKLKKFISDKVNYTVGNDLQYQKNNIGGYSFLLPEYNKFSMGLFVVSKWQVKQNFAVLSGLRYDYGRINIAPYIDKYLIEYLKSMNYDQELIDQYKWRSYKVNRDFGNFSSSAGVVWIINSNNLLKFNFGNSFRLPSANELASNGLHHGAFRHEQGTPTLSSEKGLQTDLSFLHQTETLFLSISPYFNYFSNYIYLRPSGVWSVLPDAGQVYVYTNTKAVIFGGELTFNIKLLNQLSYNLSTEYTYTCNLNDFTALTFSPPPSMRNTINYSLKKWNIYFELHSIADQNMVARNEKPTPGANLLNFGVLIDIPLNKTIATISFSIKNLLNTKYYNHLSFYRAIGLPESGRNAQLLIKIPLTFKNF